MIHFITGGERSGKSYYAQQIAEQISPTPYYLATSRVLDDNFKKRVDLHISQRNQQWTTIEEDINLSSVIQENSTVVIDCITLWITNFFMDFNQDIQKCLEESKKEIDKLEKINGNILIISNEIGMGLHGSTKQSRLFTELQGWINQYIANKAQKATFMVSGLPLKLK